MIALGSQIWVDHGNHVQQHEVLEIRRYLDGEISGCRIQFRGSDLIHWVSIYDIFETLEALHSHLNEKANAYAAYAERAAKDIERNREALEEIREALQPKEAA